MRKVILITLLSLTCYYLRAQAPQGQTVISTIAPTDSTDEYATHDDYFGLTATKIVRTLVQRDKIPTARRQEGMKVYVQSLGRWYKLLDCLGNNCWVEDRIDTLRYGTFSTGKITVQPELSDPSFLYDAYTKAGYQRFGVSKNGLLLAGRRMPLVVNVDALALIGDRNELLATDGMAIGKDLVVNGDTAAAFGYNLESNKYNSLLIGRGANRSNRVKSRWMRSVNFGAFQTIPQIELTQDTIRLNSTVLWWNGAPIGGSYSFPYTQTLTSNINWTSGNNSMFYQMGTAPYYSTWLLHRNYMRIASNSDWRSGFLGVYPDRIDISMVSQTGNLDLKIDTTGIYYTTVDTSLFTDNHLVPLSYLKDRIGGVWGKITGNFADQIDINNAINSKQNSLNAPGSSAYFLRSDLTWQIIPTSFPGFGTTGSTAARGDHNHAGTYLTSESDPIFSQTAASGITAGNITNWNAAYSNIHNPVNIGTGNGLYFTTGQSTQILNLNIAGSVSPGALSASDWNTFNNKEPAIPSGTTSDYVTGAKTIRSFPIKYLQVNIPNSALTTTSSTQLLPMFIAYSTIIGSYITFSENVSAGSGITANIKIGNSIGSPLVNLTNLTSVGPVAYRFVLPSSSDYVGSNDALYFNVTATGITSNTVTATITLIYFDSTNYY